MLVRKVNREDPDQTASDQSDLELHSLLSRPYVSGNKCLNF